MRLEVDQEADELLGAVHAHTNFSQPGAPQASYSPKPLHERLRKYSGNPLRKVEQKGDIEREDLADLAPDWELNDGFEWGLQASGAMDGEVSLMVCPQRLSIEDLLCV